MKPVWNPATWWIYCYYDDEYVHCVSVCVAAVETKQFGSDSVIVSNVPVSQLERIQSLLQSHFGNQNKTWQQHNFFSSYKQNRNPHTENFSPPWRENAAVICVAHDSRCRRGERNADLLKNHFQVTPSLWATCPRRSRWLQARPQKCRTLWEVRGRWFAEAWNVQRSSNPVEAQISGTPALCSAVSPL